MFERILLSVDGSDHARRAGTIASDLAAMASSAVTVVHIQESPSTWALDVDPTITWADSEIVDEVVRDLKDRGIDATGEVRGARGSVAGEICLLAKEIDASLIVMGDARPDGPVGAARQERLASVTHLATCLLMVVR
jgi:nucleotide-binding universal stress UspA family protein